MHEIKIICIDWIGERKPYVNISSDRFEMKKTAEVYYNSTDAYLSWHIYIYSGKIVFCKGK